MIIIIGAIDWKVMYAHGIGSFYQLRFANITPTELDVFSFNDNYCYREKISAQTELLSSDVDIHQELVRLICLTRSI